MSDRDAHSDTTSRTVVRDGDPTTGYRRLVRGPGEQHRLRDDLVPDAGTTDHVVDEHPLARLLHVTDLQIADLASPSRVEYLQSRDGEQPWQRMLPAYRPQEFLLTHAIESVNRSVRALAEERSIDAAITTGDNTDSAQENELHTFMTLMDGGPLRPAEGTRAFRDAPVRSGDPDYWTPEATPDRWKERGFPARPGVVAAAAEAFVARGIGVPWLACFGNHDCLVQGRAPAPAGYDDDLTADRKPVGTPERTDGADVLDAYVRDVRALDGGPTRAIEARSDRRLVDRAEYVGRHLASGAAPSGHGFTEDNLRDGTAYYVWDGIDGVRVVTLDTTNPAGHVDGRVDRRQLAWLEERLGEVSSRWTTRDGDVIEHDVDDRVVVLASHHGLSTMTNAYGDADAALAEEVEQLLHRFPNVVLWLNGHTHVNRVTPRHGAGGGFWEVSTSSVAEWPVQTRIVELAVLPGALVRIRCTMLDIEAPEGPTGTDLADLAALHREVAANDAGSVGGLRAEGHPEDRNVVLDVPVPERTADRTRSVLRAR